MADKRKRKQRDVAPPKKKRWERQTHQEQKASPPSEPTVSSDKTRAVKPQELQVQHVFYRICLITLLIFAGGLLFTTVSVEFIGYDELPNMGEVVQRDDGTIRFEAYYPFFRRFAIVEEAETAGEENWFTRAGKFGTGLFFYSIVNAPHWIFEVNFRNIGALFLVPFVGILIGGFYLFFFLLPDSMQSRENAVRLPTFIGVLHAILVSLIIILALVLWPNYHSLYANARFYGGQLAGSLLPAVFILLLAGTLYGSVAGGILTVIHEVRRMYRAVSD